MESTTPSGVWALRIGSLSLLLHRRNWLMCGLLTLLLTVLATLAISLGSGKMGLQDVIATLLGNGSKLHEIMAFKIRMPRVAAASRAPQCTWRPPSLPASPWAWRAA